MIWLEYVDVVFHDHHRLIQHSLIDCRDLIDGKTLKTRNMLISLFLSNEKFGLCCAIFSRETFHIDRFRRGRVIVLNCHIERDMVTVLGRSTYLLLKVIYLMSHEGYG